jgi:amino acid permease
VFPIFILSFMCTFNTLPVHASLVDPTRDRIKTVIHSSTAGTFLVYMARTTRGTNTLANFSSSDRLLLAGRLGLWRNALLRPPHHRPPVP